MCHGEKTDRFTVYEALTPTCAKPNKVTECGRRKRKAAAWASTPSATASSKAFCHGTVYLNPPQG